MYKYTGRCPRTYEQNRHTEASVCCLWRALLCDIWHKRGACHRKHVNGESGPRNNGHSVIGCHESRCEFARERGCVQVQNPAKTSTAFQTLMLEVFPAIKVRILAPKKELQKFKTFHQWDSLPTQFLSNHESLLSAVPACV